MRRIDKDEAIELTLTGGQTEVVSMWEAEEKAKDVLQKVAGKKRLTEKRLKKKKVKAGEDSGGAVNSVDDDGAPLLNDGNDSEDHADGVDATAKKWKQKVKKNASNME